MAATRITIDDRARGQARRLRRDRDRDVGGTAKVPLPARLTARALLAAGYRPAPHGSWLGPEGERYGSLDEAALVEFTAVALVESEVSRDPVEEALRQIREVAMIPVGQVLLRPEDRIRALTAKLERIGNIAADGEPDEDWRPSLIDEAGS